MSNIQNIRVNKFEVKLADTDDSVASKISWDPASPGGANFKTQKLTASANKVIIERSAGGLLFALVFAVPGLLAFFSGVPYALIKGNFPLGVFMFLWGGMFGGVGLYLLSRDQKITFDKLAGLYYRGKGYVHSNSKSRKQQGQLNEIHAIQLISERISSSGDGPSSTFTSYELNLVFRNGERINVMDHGNREEVESSALQLGKFLDVPIWKAVY